MGVEEARGDGEMMDLDGGGDDWRERGKKEVGDKGFEHFRVLTSQLLTAPDLRSSRKLRQSIMHR